MKKIAIQFGAQISIISIVLLGLLYTVVELTESIFPSFTVPIFTFLSIVTLLIYLLQVKILLNNPDYSLHVIIGSLIIRLV
ncbi:MAG: hypothetical protein AAFN93_21930, partial [Bacteroidota bacterium]